jgi:hypothetical protein
MVGIQEHIVQTRLHRCHDVDQPSFIVTFVGYQEEAARIPRKTLIRSLKGREAHVGECTQLTF